MPAQGGGMEVFMKKTISVILALFVLFGSALAGCAAENEQAPEASDTTVVLKIGNPEMTVNGVQKQIDEQGTVPVVINGRTLLPVLAGSRGYRRAGRQSKLE